MDLTDSQRRLLASADSDGRVFAKRTPEVEELIREGYLEHNEYRGGCYWVRKTSDGSKLNRSG